jgi:hypothetical protein
VAEDMELGENVPRTVGLIGARDDGGQPTEEALARVVRRETHERSQFGEGTFKRGSPSCDGDDEDRRRNHGRIEPRRA